MKEFLVILQNETPDKIIDNEFDNFVPDQEEIETGTYCFNNLSDSEKRKLKSQFKEKFMIALKKI
jgi:hypothetical protein